MEQFSIKQINKYLDFGGSGFVLGGRISVVSTVKKNGFHRKKNERRE